MKFQKPLSDLYQWYIAGNLSKKDLEGRIFMYLLDNYERYRVFYGNKSYWDEFLSWLYPRLAKAVDLYRDLGSSFDAYITALVYNASKEYRYRETDHRITEYICWQARAEEMKLCESENEYPEVWNPTQGPQTEKITSSGVSRREDISIPEGIKPKQILLLLLKSYYFVSDEFVEKVACAIGMETEVVMNMIDELRERRSEREEEILNLRDRLYCQHYRSLTYQKRMNSAQPGTAYYEKMKSRYERARRRFLAMKKRLGKMRTGASNRMIAEVMGIPKGTVDSCLFSIKNLLASYTGRAV